MDVPYLCKLCFTCQFTNNLSFQSKNANFALYFSERLRQPPSNTHLSP